MAEKIVNDSSAKAPKKDKKEPSKAAGFFQKALKYFKDCKNELKRIVWPTPKATFKSSGVVLAVVAVVCLFVSLLDTAFMALLRQVMNVAG